MSVDFLKSKPSKLMDMIESNNAHTGELLHEIQKASMSERQQALSRAVIRGNVDAVEHLLRHNTPITEDMHSLTKNKRILALL